jgi:hypothetical protein
MFGQKTEIANLLNSQSCVQQPHFGFKKVAYFEKIGSCYSQATPIKLLSIL